MDDTTTQFRSYSASDLPEIAAHFFEKFKEPGIFLIYGEMGAGKTTFMSALCHHLGFEFQGSPTFSLVNEYRNNASTLYHFDLYRIRRASELPEMGFQEYLASGAWIFIEWPQIAADFLTEDIKKIAIADHGDHREISF